MRKFICLFLVVTVLFLSGCTSEQQSDDKVIATSFYPVYIFTLNLVDGIDGLSVRCMAEQKEGCLHDYTITARDAKLLNDADAFVINGAGMEGFIEDMYESVEAISVIDSSEGIETICDDVHEHDEFGESHEHNHNHNENSHIWMSVANAKRQIVNIKNGLVKSFPEHESAIEKNCSAYLERLESVETEVERVSEKVAGKKIVTFHAAYEYLADDLGLKIVDCIESDHGGEPPAGELARLCDKIRKDNVCALFTEPQYEGSAVDVLSEETGISVFVLNPVTSGNAEKNAYEAIMTDNLKIIEKAVK